MQKGEVRGLFGCLCLFFWNATATNYYTTLHCKVPLLFDWNKWKHQIIYRIYRKYFEDEVHRLLFSFVTFTLFQGFSWQHYYFYQSNWQHKEVKVGINIIIYCSFYLCVCLCFSVCRFLFPPVPHPPSKLKYFLEDNDSFNVSTWPHCTHIWAHCVKSDHPVNHKHLCESIVSCVHSFTDLLRLSSLRKRSQRWRKGNNLLRHFKSKNIKTLIDNKSDAQNKYVKRMQIVGNCDFMFCLTFDS